MSDTYFSRPLWLWTYSTHCNVICTVVYSSKFCTRSALSIFRYLVGISLWQPRRAEVLHATWLVGPLPASERAAKRARRCRPKRPLFSCFVSVGPLPKAARSKRLRPKRSLFSCFASVCLFVSGRPTSQTAQRSAMKLGMLKLLMTGTRAQPGIPDSISRFPGNGKYHFFGRQCLLWAPFSGE